MLVTQPLIPPTNDTTFTTLNTRVRVKIVINDNIIEQVKYFKYLRYRISEYKSDLEDKLQTYNKINGAI
jgi:hypothetical protein